MTHLLILLDTIQNETDKYQDDETEKQWHQLVFRIQLKIYDGAFLRKLTAKSFIVDIRPGSKYHTGKWNKLFSFSIKLLQKLLL